MRMPLAGRVAVTVGLGILFASATGRTAVRQPGATVVPIELCRDFAVVVRGAIGALGDLRFLVDTGTARTVLTMRLADRLGLAGPDTSMFGFRGRMAARQIVLPAIRLGDARKESLEALAADLPAASGACEHDVIAGADLVRGTRFTIDYAARRLAFGGARRWRTRAAFDPRSPYLVAEVVIDGVRLRLLMDTGSELLAVYERAAPADWHKRVDAEVAADNVTGGLTLRRLFARSVEIGGARWRDVQVLLVPGGGPDSRYDGVVGPRALGLAAIEFDLVGMTFSFDEGDVAGARQHPCDDAGRGSAASTPAPKGVDTGVTGGDPPRRESIQLSACRPVRSHRTMNGNGIARGPDREGFPSPVWREEATIAKATKTLHVSLRLKTPRRASS